jgi:hypothetical protein
MVIDEAFSRVRVPQFHEPSGSSGGRRTLPRGTGLRLSTIETSGGAGSLRFAKGPGFDSRS